MLRALCADPVEEVAEVVAQVVAQVVREGLRRLGEWCLAAWMPHSSLKAH
jgi:hypothetical protein